MGDGKSWQTLGKLGPRNCAAASLPNSSTSSSFSPPVHLLPSSKTQHQDVFLTFSPSYSASLPWTYRTPQSYISIRLHQSLLHYSFAL